MYNLLIGHKLLYKYNVNILFQNINYTLNEGSILIIKGDNGVGKSTILRIILYGLSLNQGKYLFFEDVLPYFFKTRIHFLHQKIFLYYNFLNFIKNLNYFYRLHLQKNYYSDVLLLKLFYLTKYQYLLMRWLSLGQIKRILLMFYLSIAKPIWILDELSSGVDYKSLMLFTHILKNQRLLGGVIFLVSHVPFSINKINSIQL